MITTALFLTENLAEGVLPCSQICYTEITTVNSLYSSPEAWWKGRVEIKLRKPEEDSYTSLDGEAMSMDIQAY